MVKIYGAISRKSLGMNVSPRVCDKIWRASANPKRRHAFNVPYGVHFPKIIAARAMKPLPPVMFSRNWLRKPSEREAPANPARAPLSNTHRYLVAKTSTPTVSAAFGCSPTALMRRPSFVLNRTKLETTTAMRER